MISLTNILFFTNFTTNMKLINQITLLTSLTLAPVVGLSQDAEGHTPKTHHHPKLTYAYHSEPILLYPYPSHEEIMTLYNIVQNLSSTLQTHSSATAGSVMLTVFISYIIHQLIKNRPIENNLNTYYNTPTAFGG